MFVLSLLSHDLVELLFFFFFISLLFYMCIDYDFRYKYPMEITMKKEKKITQVILQIFYRYFSRLYILKF